MIIGITGYYASGKDLAAEYLENLGFTHHSLSDEIREELIKKDIKITRTNLINEGNELRNTLGSNILAKRAIQRTQSNKNYVITSIRNIHEALELKKLKNFKLISIESPVELRFERIKERDREKDPKTLEELKEKEKIEESSNETEQQLHKVRELADIKIINDSSIEELKKKLQSAVNNLES